MQYRIHNLKSIDNKAHRSKARKIIDRQVSRMATIAGNYPKPLLLNFHINRSDRINYSISCIIKMREGIVFVKERGDHIEAMLHQLFDRLKVALNKKINKERREYLRKSKSRPYLIFNEHLSALREMKETETQDSFNQLLKILLNDVAKYVRRRIKSAEMTTAIKKGKFKLQEILDDIYLLVYERFDEIMDNEGNPYIWLYQLADEVLEKLFKEIEFEKEHIERIAEIIDAEYARLEERYTIGAEKELIPLEEIEEYDHQSELRMATSLYEDDEESFLDELTLKINKEEINRIIEKELAKLTVLERTVMDLYLINQMSVHEIAGVKKISESEIAGVTERVSRELKLKLTSFMQNG